MELNWIRTEEGEMSLEPFQTRGRERIARVGRGVMPLSRCCAPLLVADPSAKAPAFALPNGSSLVSEIRVSDNVDLETLCARLREMTDAELLRFGKNNRNMCSPMQT